MQIDGKPLQHRFPLIISHQQHILRTITLMKTNWYEFRHLLWSWIEAGMENHADSWLIS
jgi:hypothetical protein